MGYRISTDNLATIRKNIKSAIKSKLEAEQATGGRLADVVDITDGHSVNVGEIDQMPRVWIVAGPHNPEQRSGHRARHDFYFSFVAMVYDSEDPERGKDDAEDLAARVYDVLIEDRTLGGEVLDVIPGQFDPAYEAAANNAVFWCAVDMAFRIERRE